MTLYALGDVHGQLDGLKRAHDLIARDAGSGPGAARIVHLGDYVDRGPDSRGVVRYLREGAAQHPDWIILRGNHDRMFCRFVRSGTVHDDRIKSGLGWLHPRLGGVDTLASYGVTATEARPRDARRAAAEAVPPEDLTFLEALPLVHETDELIFVHAGIRPGVPLAEQEEDDLIWIRDGFLDDDTDHGRLVVHGHTALDAPQHFGNRIDLDGGAGYGRPLVPVAFEGTDCFLLTDTGRVPLRP